MTRQWGVPTEQLCRQHLLGEWNEAWKVLGSLRAGRVEPIIKQAAYLNLQLDTLPDRMRDLYAEMKRRGFDPDPELRATIPDELPPVGTIVPALNRRALELRDCACYADGGSL